MFYADNILIRSKLWKQNMEQSMEHGIRQCLYCHQTLSGRADKKYCNQYCKSAHQYEQRKNHESLYFNIDRQLKRNRSLLKYFNKAGKISFAKKTC